jgi:hypothetical protein
MEKQEGSTMKRIYVWLTLAIAIAGGAIGVRRACAGPGDPPAKMPLDVAIRLDRDMAHINQANAEINRLMGEKRPFGDDADEILREYKIELQSFVNGAITIDYKTGDIKRPPQVVAAAPPDMEPRPLAKPPEKKK